MKALSHRFGGWPIPEVRIFLVREWADLAYLAPWLDDHKNDHLGLDAETNAIDPWHQGYRTRTVQMADLYTSWVIDLETNTDPLWAKVIAELIRNHRYWVAHFSEADIRFLHRGIACRDGSSPIRLGEKMPHVADTQTVLAMYDPRTVTTHSKKDRIHYKIPRLKGLKETTERLLTPELKAAEERMHARFRELAPVGHRAGKQKSIKWGFANIALDDELFLIYAGLDPVAVIRLWHLMRHELKQRGQLQRCNAALIEQWMMDQATLAGMAVDGPYARWFFDQLTAAIRENALILAQHGIGESGQGAKVGEAFTRLGVAPVKLKDGKPCWDKDAMGILKEAPYAGTVVAELANAVSAARRATKFRTTYIEPMLRAVDFGDGLMHCSARAIGTVTTRMSCQKTESAGPLHQLPKKDPRVRAAVCARPGHVLVSADFAQGEPFTMAALSGDEVYLRDLMQGDINSTIAEMIYGSAYDRRYGKDPNAFGGVHYLMRQRAKAGWLALCYGAGAQKFADTLGISFEAGAAARARLKGRYVKLWAFAERMNAEAVITLDSGHRIPLWDRFGVTEHGELFVGVRPSRLGLNAATQATQSDLLRIAMHRLNEWGWSWALRFALHDELLLEVPTWMAEQARAALEAAMTVTYRGVTVHCEATIEGRTWMPQPEEFTLDSVPDIEEEESIYATT